MLVFSFVRLFILTWLVFEQMMASIEYGGGKRTNLCHTEVNLSRGFRFNEKVFLRIVYVDIDVVVRAFVVFCIISVFRQLLRTIFRFLFKNQRDILGTSKIALTGALLSVCFATSKIVQCKCFYAFNIHFELNHMSAIQFAIHPLAPCTVRYATRWGRKHQTDFRRYNVLSTNNNILGNSGFSCIPFILKY